MDFTWRSRSAAEAAAKDVTYAEEDRWPPPTCTLELFGKLTEGWPLAWWITCAAACFESFVSQSYYYLSEDYNQISNNPKPSNE